MGQFAVIAVVLDLLRLKVSSPLRFRVQVVGWFAVKGVCTFTV